MRNINEKLNQAQMEAKEATSKAVELESAKKKLMEELDIKESNFNQLKKNRDELKVWILFLDCEHEMIAVIMSWNLKGFGILFFILEKGQKGQKGNWKCYCPAVWDKFLHSRDETFFLHELLFGHYLII